jgi:hypothetical protein
MKLTIPSYDLNTLNVAPELWAMMRPFPFVLDDKEHWIPYQFVCDKYSIPKRPKWLRRLFPQNRSNKKENIPAWLHDYTIRFRVILGLSLMDCHDIFNQAMDMVGIDKPSRIVKYTTVVITNWAIVEDGTGTPPKEVRDFIAENGWGL